MNITFTNNGIKAFQSSPKEKFYTETALFHALKKALQADGLDVIKRLPERDGHMFGNYILDSRK